MPSLVLLRHAKSAYPPAVADHDRPLNGRGRRDAPVAGRMIGRAISQIDLVLVSTATRAQQTWDLVRPGVSFEDARDVPELYLASADAMMRRIRAVDCDTLMLIAHNPGLEVLAERLSRDPESPVYRQMLSKFPTSAFALLEEDKPFSRWGYGAADLTAFEIARGK